MGSRSMGFMVFFLAGLFTVSAQAAETGKKQKIRTSQQYFAELEAEAPYAAVAADNLDWFNEDSAKKMRNTVAAREQKRGLASRQGDESMLSSQYVDLRGHFLKIKTADELDTFLRRLDAEYDSYPADVRFFAAQMIPLINLRGFVWKMIPYVKDTKIAHSFILTYVKHLASRYKIYLPTEQWDAGFAYITQPYLTQGKLAKQISSDAELQGFLAGPLYAALSKAAKRINGIDLSQQEIVLDNKLFYGIASFQDDVDRFRMIGNLEKHALLASIRATLADLCFARAYSIQGSLKLQQKLAKLYGYDSLFWTVDGVPASKRVSTIRGSEFASWGTLLPDGEDWMQLAFRNLRQSVYLSAIAWTETKQRPASEAYVLNTGFGQIGQRINNYQMENMLAMVKGATELRSAVTGETALVDLPGFFQRPPKDLKKLYPTDFSNEPEWITKTLKDEKGEASVTYRNYFWKRPNKWDLGQYRALFPSGVGSDADLIRNTRVISQAWAGGLVAMPLDHFIGM